MRGTPHLIEAVGADVGIIPAYAGNTIAVNILMFPFWDHPRVCGEHRSMSCRMVGLLGSSPRMRGTHPHAARNRHGQGIIPAYAGNTESTLCGEHSARDHPRVCGEHQPRSRRTQDRPGSSPRMRGTLIIGASARTMQGIIPAYAGNTVVVIMVAWGVRDHPRVCGEHFRGFSSFAFPWGSSPRMRGTRRPPVLRLRFRRIIPAYAGNTSLLPSRLGSARDHPRVCGEHAAMTLDVYADLGSSPRMRGTRQGRARRDHPGGIIPAYAGNTLRDYSNFVVSKFMSFVFHLV